MRVPRVLFLALDTYSRTGGLQRFNQRVIACLSDIAGKGAIRDCRVMIMRDVDSDFPPVERAHLRGFGPRRLAFMREALAAARQSDILFLGQVNLLPVGFLARLLNPRLKICLFVHGVEVWNDPVYRRKRVYEPLLLKAVGMVASVSRYTADIMAREFSVNTQKFRIFPNAVDALAEDIVPPAAGAPVVLCVTRMAVHDHGKNVDKVLRAFKLVLERQPEARLEIVGDGVLKPELVALAESLGIQTSVTFHGRVSDAVLDDCYRRASCFVLPSSKEGFGIVYLEAWKYGLPVICGTQGASKEVVSDRQDGFVIDPSDVPALAAAMETLVGDRQRAAAMGQAGKQKLQSRYLNAHFRANLEQLLGELS
ncbi:Glycosyltransferase involved in cell wall bisynthesis [Rhizobium sp. RU35A]|uniref:glycosyltransferase family 4 protein n=1 Tax=Rhizobium sp. RU35A TaxID=1907414 RepID=UPI000956AC54|nr:glycosyltransferase family 4 protein [Rhizobium sp. RU35A]SIQ00640.1 Glycosyltransferase involved in cell wall bisynthesis [Rhizobium sp. RU35A]